MPEAVIVATARSPIGRAFKGSLKDLRPDDLTATIVRAALDKVPALDPAGHRRPDARLRPARRRAGLQHGPRRQRPARHGPPARDDDHPLLLLVAADHPHGDARDQGRRGRRLHLRRRRDGVPVRQGQQRLPAGHAEPGVRRRRGPRRQGGRERCRQLARPARGRPGPGHLRRDGPDRGEPRAAEGRLTAGDGRVRRPQPEPGREGHQRRLLGAGDHAGHHARRHGRQQGRRPAGRHHARGPVRAEAGLPAGRPRHRGQRLSAQRRRRRRGRHERHEGPRAGPDPAGPHRLHRGHRPVAGDHGLRPGRRLQPRPASGPG